MPKGLAFQQFHGDESPGVDFINFVDGADVRVVQGRCGLGFTAETLQSLGVLGEFFRQEFQGYKTVEAGVFGLVHNAHAATAELLHDAVVRDGLADQLEARSGRPY